jgi:hypothetical protein
MAKYRNPDLVDALRATLQQIEQSEKVSRDDRTLARLKRHILLTLADLEREEIQEPKAA